MSESPEPLRGHLRPGAADASTPPPLPGSLPAPAAAEATSATSAWTILTCLNKSRNGRDLSHQNPHTRLEACSGGDACGYPTHFGTEF
ncbi:hypothetical protein ON010_g15479 [Phytophthora cinnamomi]|nr:hypothetical protein ON010_g15479 [Phytophthora cinnamomi]